MYPLSYLAVQALRRSHAMRTRVTAYTTRQGVLTDLPLTDGSVTLDAGSQLRGTADLTFAPEPGLWPTGDFDILSPLGTDLLIERGVVIPGGEVEWVPLLRGPIQKVSRSIDAGGASAIKVTVNDASQRIADARLEAPLQTTNSEIALVVIQQLITDVIENATITVTATSNATAPTLEVDKERWSDGIEKLATAIGAEVYADRNGDFVIRDVPVLEDQDPVWRVTTGDDGVVISEDQEASREQAYSAVIAETVSSAADVPVLRGRAIDADPLSPTYFFGEFGKKIRYYASPLLTTQAQTDSAAASILERVKGMHSTISITSVVNPALEPGDVILTDSDRYIIDAVSIPLTDSGTQGIKVRGVALPPEQATSNGATQPLSPDEPAPTDPELIIIWDDSLIPPSAYVFGTTDPVLTVNSREWAELILMGYRGRSDDAMEALYVPTSALAKARESAAMKQ